MPTHPGQPAPPGRPAAPGAATGESRPVLDDAEAHRRLLLLTALKVSLADLGIASTLARKHRLVLRYTDGIAGPNGLTDPELHVFAPARCVATTEGKTRHASITASASHRNPDSPADQALTTIISILAADGYSFSIPSWDGDAFLRIDSAVQAHTDLTITSHGEVTWEYRTFHYPHAGERRLISTAIELLDPDHTKPAPAWPPTTST
jgi:hypothetical protein